MIESRFRSGDYGMVVADNIAVREGERGLIAAFDDDVVEMNLIDPPRRCRVPRSIVRFDGDPPLHPDTGRPITLINNDRKWPLQPKLADYVLRVHAQKHNGWLIFTGEPGKTQTHAFGGRVDVEDYWNPTMLPAHRAWLQSLLHEAGTTPGDHKVSDGHLRVAHDAGLRE